ncbi:hypothetical protein QWZ10_23850 [Paracoccus cavernae]|uniref:Uncharacterized protein n=1 Tax=Paracoccus cavernae TaxID=1571207 RepID=A0ABT8DFW8_9RHOB|nr:hypothetical protein [Paracoccus cavernae]
MAAPIRPPRARRFDRDRRAGARLPSQRRFAARALSRENGITLTAEEMAQLERLRDQGLAAVN